MIILDTNVLSELLRPDPAPPVLAWAGSQALDNFAITAVTQAELLYGLGLLPAGRRRTRLETAVGDLLARDFAGRILPFDQAAATHYADLAIQRRRTGQPISQFDAQIAAIARHHGATLATRNVRDFVGCGVTLVDPWTA